MLSFKHLVGLASMKSLKSFLVSSSVGIAMLCTVCIACGCSHNFYREINGVSNSVALTLPEEDAVKIQVLEYLSGSKTIVKEPSTIAHSYTTVSSNDYFGVIHIREQRTSSIQVEPVSTNTVEKAEAR